MDDYICNVVNPEAFEQNKTAQEQLAKWLLQFGLRIGTIKPPAGFTDTKVIYLPDEDKQHAV